MRMIYNFQPVASMPKHAKTPENTAFSGVSEERTRRDGVASLRGFAEPVDFVNGFDYPGKYAYRESRPLRGGPPCKRTRRDSNPRSSESESDAISSFATGTRTTPDIIAHLIQNGKG